eukprot:jgi/Psemu1/24593/gm1.24593_g
MDTPLGMQLQWKRLFKFKIEFIIARQQYHFRLYLWRKPQHLKVHHCETICKADFRTHNVQVGFVSIKRQFYPPLEGEGWK